MRRTLLLAGILFLAGCAVPRDGDSAAEKERAQKQVEIVSRAVSDLIETSKFKPEVKAELQASMCISAEVANSFIADASPPPYTFEAQGAIMARFCAWVFGFWLLGFLILASLVIRAWWNNSWTFLMTFSAGNNEHTIPDCFWAAFWWPFYVLPIAFMLPWELVVQLRERNLRKIERRKRLEQSGGVEVLYAEINKMCEDEGVKDYDEQPRPDQAGQGAGLRQE